MHKHALTALCWRQYSCSGHITPCDGLDLICILGCYGITAKVHRCCYPALYHLCMLANLLQYHYSKPLPHTKFADKDDELVLEHRWNKVDAKLHVLCCGKFRYQLVAGPPESSAQVINFCLVNNYDCNSCCLHSPY